MSELIGKKFSVFDHGYVILRDVMGDDQRIVNAARISYGDGTKAINSDMGVLDYLIRHRHTSPLEMPVLHFQIKLPIFVERQWVRHRTCSMNELSGRYSVMPEEYYYPEIDAVRAQSTTNKQGRGEKLIEAEVHDFRKTIDYEAHGSFKAYKHHIDVGIARELARIQLPLSTYTEKVWQMNLHNLLHFLKLRTDSHAQYEIQCYANVIESIVAELFPLVYKSWKNHVKDAVSFSADEVALVLKILHKDSSLVSALELHSEFNDLSKTRKLELKKKLGLCL